MTLAHDYASNWHPTVERPPVKWWLSALLLSVVFISFRPFSDRASAAAAATSGDIVNQLGFGMLGLISLWLLIRRSQTHTLRALAHPLWLLMVPFLCLSVLSADSPSSAARALVFSMIVVFAAMAALSQLRTMQEMVSTIALTSGLTVFLGYVAVFVFPEHGVHEASGHEAVHAGLWRGIYDHKNVASYVLGCFAIFGYFVARNGRPKTGLLIALAAVVFVFNSGSKTVLGVLPISIMVVAVAHWVSLRPLKVVILLAPVFVLALVTLGSVIFPSILLELRTYSPGLSYTGRTDLWIFGLDHLMRSPWFGYGIESFWGTPRAMDTPQPIDLNWDVRESVHAHNSWLDAALTFGIPGALVLVLVLLVLPVIDYARIPSSGNAGRLATLFITIWLFTSLGASLESFFFRRSDPVWFCMLIAVVGLRLTAYVSRQQNRALMHR